VTAAITASCRPSTSILSRVEARSPGRTSAPAAPPAMHASETETRRKPGCHCCTFPTCPAASRTSYCRGATSALTSTSGWPHGCRHTPDCADSHRPDGLRCRGDFIIGTPEWAPGYQQPWKLAPVLAHHANMCFSARSVASALPQEFARCVSACTSKAIRSK
jgi:hypothetical protein